MKWTLLALGAATLLGLTGCEIENRGPRGGYYDRPRIRHGEYHDGDRNRGEDQGRDWDRDHDHDHDGDKH